jgi:hypothetical protein
MSGDPKLFINTITLSEVLHVVSRILSKSFALERPDKNDVILWISILVG